MLDRPQCLLYSVEIVKVLPGRKFLQQTPQFPEQSGGDAARAAGIVQQRAEFVLVLCDATHGVQQGIEMVLKVNAVNGFAYRRCGTSWFLYRWFLRGGFLCCLLCHA